MIEKNASVLATFDLTIRKYPYSGLLEQDNHIKKGSFHFQIRNKIIVL